MNSEISAHKRDMILHWHHTGYSIDETARLLKLPHQAVIDVINHEHTPDNANHPAGAQDIPLF